MKKIFFFFFLLNLKCLYGWDGKEHFIYAKICFFKGLYKEAEFHLNLSKDKSDNPLLVAAVYNNLAIIREKETKFKEAEELYSLAHKLAAKNKWIYLNFFNFKKDRGEDYFSEMGKMEEKALNYEGLKGESVVVSWEKKPKIQLPHKEEIEVGVISQKKEDEVRLWGEIFYNLIEELDFVPLLANNYQIFYGTSLVNYNKQIILLSLYFYNEELQEETHQKQVYSVEENKFVFIPYFETIRRIKIKAKLSLIKKEELFVREFIKEIEKKYPNKRRKEVPLYDFSLWRSLLIPYLEELKKTTSFELCHFRRYYIKWVEE